MEPQRIPRLLVFAAVFAFLAANLIHNGGRLDPAAFPGLISGVLLLLRRQRAFLFATAVCVALPAIAFFKWAALTEPSTITTFLNHLLLLLSASLAAAGAAAGFWSADAPSPPTAVPPGPVAS